MINPVFIFFTYDKPKHQGDKYSKTALTALCRYIQKLKREGSSYSDMAILSSNNDNLMEIGTYLRSQNLPLMLHSSKNFAQNRLILDALFLLKFLINPYDNINLKALLRTPYFHLSDQELADSSYEYSKLCKDKDKEIYSFWSFIRKKFSNRVFVQSLSAYLTDKRKQGLIQSFEKALMDSGIMELAYFQDSTGSSSANLWKLLCLLKRSGSSPLEIFYSLIAGEEGENSNKEAPSCEHKESIPLMTIHKSKGLEFQHVIVMDSSIADSSLKLGDERDNFIIFDEDRQKMALAVPLGGRDNSKIKSYGHEVYIKKQKWERLLERERLFYVAMTRAKQSLALFIPNAVPQKNSWLNGISFFKEFAVPKGGHPLLEEQYDEKDKAKLKSWKLNEGLYTTGKYLVCVQSSESVCQANTEKSLNIMAEFRGKDTTESKGDGQDSSKQKVSALTGGEKYFGGDRELQVRSSGHFVKDTMEGEEVSKENVNSYKGLPKEDRRFSYKTGMDFKKSDVKDKNMDADSLEKSPQKNKIKDSFYFSREKNILFKTHLGNHLHFFLQRLSHRSLDQVQPLIENSFLSKGDQEKIQRALIYINELKKPLMSSFLKTGFSEWPFKMKKNNVLLQGQVDLWGWESDEIHLFDYKSSLSQSSLAKKQLIFYSWVLNEFYHPKKIWMYEVYPFQQKVCSLFYNESHNSLVENWLTKINPKESV